MSTTDTRSGFRLPWSSDRSHENHSGRTPDATDEPAQRPDETGTSAHQVSDGADTAGGEAWPGTDANSRFGQNDTGDASSPHTSPKEPAAMVDTFSASAPPSVAAPRKPSRLLAELAAAMRATAETAREQALAQVEAEARQVVDGIRAGSVEGEAQLRRLCDEDIAGIRDWSKAEIARIREVTDRRISERKTDLESEIADHAAAIERRVEEVQATVSAYETDMAEFFERLLQESDPGRLANMAESMPEPPSLVRSMDVEAADTSSATEPALDAVEGVEATGGVETLEAAGEAATDETAGEVATDEPANEGEVETMVEPEAEVASDAWAGADDTWRVEVSQLSDADPVANDGWDALQSGAEVQGTEPETSEASGEPVDRDAIMAALEAAAEAVVAAEAAAESADQAEAAADVAETAAELLVGRVDPDDEADLDPEAQAALAARVDAGGFESEPSLADRLASLLPGAGASDTEPVTTQVVVTGLVSVASIASFKRHLGRVTGVQSVSVASGPDGEFVFNVTHRADVLFRDVVPTLPGFGARVTGSGDGVVNVAARDPETEG